MGGPGRPSLYKPEFAAQAFELCLAGATNQDLADSFEVGHSTIDNWLHKHPEFVQSVKRGRAIADGRVAHGLYSRAIGYTYEATRALLHRGQQDQPRWRLLQASGLHLLAQPVDRRLGAALAVRDT